MYSAVFRSTRETERRVDLMMEKSEIVNALQQLGHLLQSEMDLFEQLNSQSSPDRYSEVLWAKPKQTWHVQTYNIYFIYFRSERLSLQDQSESASIKANQLLAEILEVKQQLEEVEDRYSAGMGITHRIRTEFTVYRHGVKCALSLSTGQALLPGPTYKLERNHTKQWLTNTVILISTIKCI